MIRSHEFIFAYRGTPFHPIISSFSYQIILISISYNTLTYNELFKTEILL